MRLLSLIDRLIGAVLCVLVAGMMMLTFTDVMFREVLARPLIIAPELTTIGLAAMVYVGLPLVSFRDEHITISLFENLFKGRAQSLKRGLVALLMAGLSVVLAVRLWVHAGKLGTEVMMFLQFKKSYIAQGMSILAGITAVAFLARAAQHFRDMRQPPAPVGEAGGKSGGA
jgi:TRAP-type C4-dicarboxylate transport system permease small subunit